MFTPSLARNHHTLSVLEVAPPSAFFPSSHRSHSEEDKPKAGSSFEKKQKQLVNIIRKEYDRKCDQLRRQFMKDQGTQVIDKTRAVVKHLHSRIRVAIRSFDSISKRIERMRDE